DEITPPHCPNRVFGLRPSAIKTGNFSQRNGVNDQCALRKSRGGECQQWVMNVDRRLQSSPSWLPQFSESRRHFLLFGQRAYSYSITSAARASTVAGTSRPSALAVLRLSTVSYLLGACTGRSAGFSPLRMRST